MNTNKMFEIEKKETIEKNDHLTEFILIFFKS